MNLTSLANVRQWVGSSTDTDNPLLTRLIGMSSRTILNYLQRPELGLQTITETISGKDSDLVQLRNWPVITVNSLTINTVNVPPSPSPSVSYGFFIEPVVGGLAGRPQNLRVRGAFAWGGNAGYAIGYNSNGMAAFAPGGGGGGRRAFPAGFGNILVDYTFGYCTQNEPQTVPSSGYQVTPNQVYGSWAQDNGVSYANGTAMVAVASAPTIGQYVPPNQTGDSPTTYYQFAAADANANVSLNYNFVPFDIEQACIEHVGERYRYKSRIGEKSHSMSGQETTSYDNAGLTIAIRNMLAPYRLSWGG